MTPRSRVGRRAPHSGDRPAATAGSRSRTVAERVLGDDEATLLDIVDNVLTKGVVLTGDVLLGLAQVDLVYARLSLLLCAADRVRPGEHPDPLQRIHDRHVLKRQARVGGRASLALAARVDGQASSKRATRRRGGGRG